MSELKSRFEWYISSGSSIDPIHLYEFFIDHLPEFIKLSPHDYDIAVAKAIQHRQNGTSATRLNSNINSGNSNISANNSNTALLAQLAADPPLFLSRDEC